MKKLLICIPLLLLVFGCESPISVSDEGAVDDFAAKAMAEEEGTNNLSFPAIFTDGDPLLLRGVEGQSTLGGGSTLKDGVLWYHQGDPLNFWQAENEVKEAGAPAYVAAVDWGDNLEARPWRAGGVVRVETVLYAKEADMDGYQMAQLNDISGPGELWGSNGAKYTPADGATIFSRAARLIIQKLTPNVAHVWNPVTMQWSGASAPFYQGDFTAEINVQGKTIYGYNWFTSSTADGAGLYRLTFALDQSVQPCFHPPGPPEVTPVTCASLTEAEIYVSEDVHKGAPDNTGKPAGGTAVVDGDNELTYIDVELTSAPGQGGGGKPAANGTRGRKFGLFRR